MRLPYLTSRLQGFGTTIFTEMTALAIEHDAVNLGQGFPNFDGPPSLLEAAQQAIRDGHNQYAPLSGVPALRHAIAEHQRRFWGLTVDPDREVTVTAGATEAICATLQALCEAGDEVAVFEPLYDSYRASIAMAGAVERPIRLHSPTFEFDPDEFEMAITDKTRLVLLNTPHNPTGKVFSRAELELIARVAVERDLIVVTDEVYEHFVYEGEHIPIASLPGMAERTVTISSAGKTFSATGWKVGWACAAPALTIAIRAAKQFMSFANATPFQHALAPALGLPDDYYVDLLDTYRRRRDRLVAGLAEVGLDPLVPHGSYFVLADIRPLGQHDDVEFCRTLPGKVGVAAVPSSVFYANPNRPVDVRHLVRFAFCKTDDVIDTAVERLHALVGTR